MHIYVNFDVIETRYHINISFQHTCNMHTVFTTTKCNCIIIHTIVIKGNISFRTVTFSVRIGSSLLYINESFHIHNVVLTCLI